MTHFHPYHLVTPSPWPLIASFSALMVTTGGVGYFHHWNFGGTLLTLGLLLLTTTSIFWWRDVISEGTFEGHHTQIVQSGLNYGMILFIISEVFFFVSFFWAYFNSSLNPAIELGATWPPIGIIPLNPWNIPLLNTALLLSSGATITWCHHAIIASLRNEALIALSLTILLGLIFTALQAFEYYEAPFTIADSVYGSTFYLATGFHGFHVIIGTLFLIVCLISLYQSHFSSQHHVGFESAALYWHFVDVVWLFLFISIYIWGFN